MSHAFNAVEIELVVEHLQVDHRPVERIAVAVATQVALHLLGVVALVAAHFFHLRRQLRSQRRQWPGRIVMHRHRQHVDHRTGGAERGGADTAHKDKTGGEVVLAAKPSQPERHQRESGIGGAQLLRLGMVNQRLKGLAIQGQRLAQQMGAGALSRQRQRGERGGRRQLRPFFAPVLRIARIGRGLLIALILFHHLAEGNKGRRLRPLLTRGGAVNIGDAARQRREAETVHHQMVIALIPVPVLVAEAHQAVMPQRRAAQHAQIARHILAHQRARGGVGIRFLTQVDNRRLAEALRRRPLHRLAILFAEGHVQRVGLLHAGYNSLRQQRAVQRAAQLDKVRDGIGIGVFRQLIGDPDAWLRRDQRQGLKISDVSAHQRFRHCRSRWYRMSKDEYRASSLPARRDTPAAAVGRKQTASRREWR